MAEEVLQRTITEAPSYLQPGIEKYLEGATAQAGQAIDTSKFAPQVAGLGAIQQQAQQQAATQAGLGTLQFDPTTGAVSGVSGTGVAGYQPYLQAAAGLTSPTAYQQFQSPYQQAVTQATLTSFDEQAKAREQQIKDAAIAAGAFGGGREGVQRAEFQTGAARERALLQAGLLQQGFGQAQQLASQQYGQQTGLAQLLPGLQGTDISRLGSLGALNQAQEQARLDAQREAARQAAYLPQEQLQQYTGAVTGIMGGYPAAFQSSNVPNPTPLQTALGFGATAAGIYGGLGGKLFS